MATQARCLTCKIRIVYGPGCKVSMFDHQCPQCKGQVCATSYLSKWPTVEVKQITRKEE